MWRIIWEVVEEGEVVAAAAAAVVAAAASTAYSSRPWQLASAPHSADQRWNLVTMTAQAHRQGQDQMPEA